MSFPQNCSHSGWYFHWLGFLEKKLRQRQKYFTWLPWAMQHREGQIYCVVFPRFSKASKVLGATTLSMTTFSIMTLSIKDFYITLSISDNQHKRHSAKQHCHYDECLYANEINSWAEFSTTEVAVCMSPIYFAVKQKGIAQS